MVSLVIYEEHTRVTYFHYALLGVLFLHQGRYLFVHRNLLRRNKCTSILILHPNLIIISDAMLSFDTLTFGHRECTVAGRVLEGTGFALLPARDRRFRATSWYDSIGL